MRKKYIPTYSKKNIKITGKKVIISTIAVVLSLCVLTVGMFAAKYINEKSSEGLVIAKNFYFTSNLLDGKEHTLAPDSTSVTFTLGNHEDELRYSEVDIEYTVTVDNGATVANDTGTGTLASGSKNDKEVTISDLKPGTTYNVKAVGKGGYTKTLTATIVVPEKKAQLYYLEDKSLGEYILLTVWNEGDEEGEVTITYTGIPDNTNPNMNDWKKSDNDTEVSQKVKIGPHESKVFRFFGETKITVTDAAAKELY